MLTAEIRVAPRLWTIDALRGAAALGVVLFHANSVVGAGPTPVAQLVHGTLSFGRYGVWLFFVISGFCIHYRWAMAARGGSTTPPDFVAFWRRRFRRLYPPYLVALLLYVSLRFGSRWMAPPVLRRIGLHLLMLHNLDPSAVSGINEVFWTLAVEEQLYLLYFVVVRLRAVTGWPVILSIGLAARVGWFALAAMLHRFAHVDILITESAATQWLVWMLGALSVEAMLGVTRVPAIFTRFGSGAVLLALAALTSYSFLHLLPAGMLYRLAWLAGDVMWGLAFFVVVNLAVDRQRQARAPGRAGSALAAIGLFSYSLYLTHEVVTSYGWDRLAHTVALAPGILLIAGLTLASVVFGKIFFMLFERPFLSSSSGLTRPAIAI